MNKACGICGADIAADDAVAIDEEIGIDGTLGALVIFNFVSIACDLFLLIVGQVKTLTLLNFVIARKDLIELRGNGHGGDLDGIARDLPTELTEEVLAI